MIQRIAALLALGPSLDKLYQEAAAVAFTAEELGIPANLDPSNVISATSHDRAPSIRAGVGN